MVSARIILRADGQTSRGSDFPGGEWTLSNEPDEAGGGTSRWRMRLVLRSRLLRQELRYEGLFFGVQSQAQDPEQVPPSIELRVVGQASRSVCRLQFLRSYYMLQLLSFSVCFTFKQKDNGLILCG